MYKIIRKTLTFNKPGLSPTVKDGHDMGYLDVSYPAFAALSEVNGWLSIFPNQWVKKSDCEVADSDDDPGSPPEPVEKQRAIIQTWNGVEYVTTETWERIE